MGSAEKIKIYHFQTFRHELQKKKFFLAFFFKKMQQIPKGLKKPTDNRSDWKGFSPFNLHIG